MTLPATRISQAFALIWMVTVAYSTAVAEISLGASLGALVVAGVRREILPWAELGPWPRRILILWAAFAAWVVLSHFFAIDRSAALGDLHKLYRFTAILPFAFFPWDRKFRIALYGALTVLAVALAAEALPPYLRQRVGRVEAGRLHYNTLAQYGAAISLLLSVAALGETRAGPRWRLMWGLGALLGVAILVCTLSRMAWAAWFTALPVIGLLAVARRHRWILVVAGVAILATAFAVPHLQQRLGRFTEFDDPEFMRRYDMWDVGEHLVAEYPLFGVGPSGVGLRYDELKGGMLVGDERRWVHLHNDPINIAAYHGVPAALIWVVLGLSIYVMVARWIFLTPRAQRPPPLAVGAALAIHVFFVCGLLHDTLPIYRKFAWYLLLWGLLIHASSRRALEEPQS
jgi:O-antigen ligase